MIWVETGLLIMAFVSDQPVGTLKHEDTRVVSLYPSPITATA